MLLCLWIDARSLTRCRHMNEYDMSFKTGKRDCVIVLGTFCYPESCYPKASCYMMLFLFQLQCVTLSLCLAMWVSQLRIEAVHSAWPRHIYAISCRPFCCVYVFVVTCCDWRCCSSQKQRQTVGNGIIFKRNICWKTWMNGLRGIDFQHFSSIAFGRLNRRPLPPLQAVYASPGMTKSAVWFNMVF